MTIGELGYIILRKVVTSLGSTLKGEYLLLDIFPDHQRFLGFSWVMSEGKPSFFMFTVLPFGLSSGKHWRSQGIHVVYLHDSFDVKSTKLSSEIYPSVIRSDLALAGFLANDNKSVWVPV